MRDAQLQELQRRYLEGGGVEDEATWVAAALRAGRLPLHRVRFAAYLGSPGARLVAPIESGLEDLFVQDWDPDSPQGNAPRQLQQALRHAGKIAAARVCASAAKLVREGLVSRGEDLDLLERFDRGLVPLFRCASGQGTGLVSLYVERAIRDGLIRPNARTVVSVEEWFCGFVLKGCLDCVRGDRLGFKNAPGLVLWITRRFMNEVLEEDDPLARRLSRRVRDEVAPWVLEPRAKRAISPAPDHP